MMLAAADTRSVAGDVRRNPGADPARVSVARFLDLAAARFADGYHDEADEALVQAADGISRTVSDHEARARSLRAAGAPCGDADRAAESCRGLRARVEAIIEFSHYRETGGELARLSSACTALAYAAGHSGLARAAAAAGLDGGGRRVTLAALSAGRAADSLLRAELGRAQDSLLSAAESFDSTGAGLREAARNGEESASAPAIAAAHFRDECRRLVGAVHGAARPRDADGIRLAPGDMVQAAAAAAEPGPDGLPHPARGGPPPPRGRITGIHGGLVTLAAFPEDPRAGVVVPSSRVRQAQPGGPRPGCRPGPGRESGPGPRA